MAELKFEIGSTYVGPSCGEAGDAPHAFHLWATKARTGGVQIVAREGRCGERGVFTTMLTFGTKEPEAGNREVRFTTASTRATAKVVAAAAMAVLADLASKGWIASIPSATEVQAAIR